MESYPITRIVAGPSQAASRFFNITELLVEVLMQCVLDDIQKTYALHMFQLVSPEPGFFPVSLSKRAPLVQSRVNKHWRKVINSCPILWSRVCFTIIWRAEHEYWYGMLQKFAKAVSFWLARSEDAPVDLHLALHRPYHLYPDSKYEKLILDLLAALISRQGHWTNISLYLPLDTMIKFRDSFQEKYPIQWPLRLLWGEPENHLDMKRRRTLGSGSPDPKVTTLFMQAERGGGFDHLSFPTELPLFFRRTGFAYIEISFSENIQRSRLRSLTISEVNVSHEEFAKLPFAFPLLEVLTVSRIDPISQDMSDEGSDDEKDAGKQEVVFRNLRKLTVNNLDGFPLENITAPALEFLEVDETHTYRGDDDPPYYDLDGLTLEFLKRSEPDLKSFTFRFCYDRIAPKGEGVMSVLQEFQNIQKLYVSGSILYHGLYEALCDPTFCPHLKSIYNDGDEREIEDGADLPRADVILKIVRQRCSASVDPTERGDATRSMGNEGRVYLEELSIPMDKEEFRKVSDAIALESLQLKLRNCRVGMGI